MKKTDLFWEACSRIALMPSPSMKAILSRTTAMFSIRFLRTLDTSASEFPAAPPQLFFAQAPVSQPLFPLILSAKFFERYFEYSLKVF